MLVSLGLQRVKIGEQNHGERAVLSFLSPLPRGWSRVGAVCAKPRVVTDAAGSAVGVVLAEHRGLASSRTPGASRTRSAAPLDPRAGRRSVPQATLESTPLTTPMPAHHPSHPP